VLMEDGMLEEVLWACDLPPLAPKKLVRNLGRAGTEKIRSHFEQVREPSPR